MKIVGLITEYNPFHNGHLYHIQQAKRTTGADAVIVVMSGDYVQRGVPAVMPKRLRAESALECGASAVFDRKRRIVCRKRCRFVGPASNCRLALFRE